MSYTYVSMHVNVKKVVMQTFSYNEIKRVIILLLQTLCGHHSGKET